MALRLNPAPPEPSTHSPSFDTFPKLDCPTLFIPIDRVREITNILSAPPTLPFDIDNVLASPPALPFDIPNPLAAPPALPFDIDNILTSPPAEPFDIPNPLAAPPADGLDIATSPLPPPAEPVDIPNPPIAPPAEGPEVTPGSSEYEDTFVDATLELTIEDPRFPVGTDIRRHPTLGQEADTTINPLVDTIFTDQNGERGHPDQQEYAAGGYLDPRNDLQLRAHLLDGKVGKIIADIDTAIQVIQDPSVLIKMGRQLSVDGVTSFGRNVVNTLANTAQELVQTLENPNMTRQIEIAQEAIEQNNLYTPEAPYRNATNAGGDNEGRALFGVRDLNLASTSRDQNRAFNAKMARISVPREARDRSVVNVRARSVYFGMGHKPAGQIPAKFDNDLEDGSIVTKNKSQRPHDIITDNEAYVPLSFTDLRPVGGEGSQRSIYFRPFITSLTEDFSPEWDKKTLYGRSDQVVTYMSTVRTIFLGFELHAFYPDDLKMMYKKLSWLSSMVYPEYDKELLLKSGPVCRMRVGDVISGNNKQGLSGIIDSLSFDYTDSIWEVEDGSKAPRSIKVSISFHALHEVPIGRGADGNFGGVGYINFEGKFTTSQFDPIGIKNDSATEHDFFRTIGKPSDLE